MRIALLIELSLASALFTSSCSLISTTDYSPVKDDAASVVARYLDDHIFEPGFGGKIFCAAEMLYLDQLGSTTKAYVWALCIEYYEDGQTLQMGTAVSEPLLVYTIEFQGNTMATGYAEPGDGTHFADDINHMFPNKVVERMCLGDIPCTNARMQRLQAVITEQVEQTYNLPITNELTK